MLKLDQARDPYWIDVVEGVRLQVRPCNSSLMMAARRDVGASIPEDASDEDAALAMCKALATRAVIAWEGVGDADGNPVDPTPERIGQLLEIWPVFERFQLTYASKGLLLESEKNVSAPSPTGTTARAAAKTTAKRARRAAKPAPTGSTARKPAKRTRSGS